MPTQKEERIVGMIRDGYMRKGYTATEAEMVARATVYGNPKKVSNKEKIKKIQEVANSPETSPAHKKHLRQIIDKLKK